MTVDDKLVDLLMNLIYDDMHNTLNKKRSLNTILEIDDWKYLGDNTHSKIYENKSPILPVRKHRLNEELLEKQRKFAFLIYKNRDHESI